MTIHRSIAIEIGEFEVHEWLESQDRPQTVKMDEIVRILVFNFTNEELTKIIDMLDGKEVTDERG